MARQTVPFRVSISSFGIWALLSLTYLFLFRVPDTRINHI